MIDWLCSLLAMSPTLLPGQFPRAAAMRIAGLISVADWIASSEYDFRFHVTDASHAQMLNASDYLVLAQQQAHDALQRIGWLRGNAPTAPASFAALFPTTPTPRPLQRGREKPPSLKRGMKAPSQDATP